MKVLPSDACRAMSQLFPNLESGQPVTLSYGHEHQVAGILEMIERIPSELMRAPPQQLADYFLSVGILRNAVEQWRARGASGSPVGRVGGRRDPLSMVYGVLSDCPDAVADVRSAELEMIDDPDYRGLMLEDIGVTERALGNAEWKPATVMAGSVIESLLLWALRRVPAERRVEAREGIDWRALELGKPDDDLLRWNLAQYVQVALAVGLLSTDAAQVAGVARGFRNLIHPGRAERLAQACDRSTAYEAFAALLLVLRDLEREG